MDSVPLAPQTEPPSHPQDGSVPAPSSWPLSTDNPQRYSTPSGTDTSDSKPLVEYSSMSHNLQTPNLTSLHNISGVQLADGQGFPLPSGSTFQPVFTVSSTGGYETRLEEYSSGIMAGGLQSLALPTSSTLHHLQQVLQHSTDRKGLPPHLQVVPLFDPNINLGSLQRSMPLTQVSMASGIGSLPPSSLNLGVGSMASLSTSQAPTSLASSTLVSGMEHRDQLVSQIPREQLMSHTQMLPDQPPMNNNVSMTNQTLFPMVHISGGFRPADGGAEHQPLLMGVEHEAEQTMQLALSEVACKQLPEGFVNSTGDGTATAFHNVHGDTTEGYHPSSSSLNMAAPEDGSGLNTQTSNKTTVNLITGSMTDSRVLDGPHGANASLSANNMISGNSTDLHMMVPVSQGMMSTALHSLDPVRMVDDSSDEDNQEISVAMDQGQDTFNMQQQVYAHQRKSLRIAERDRTPSPVTRPVYMPKSYYSTQEMWCEDCQDSYEIECPRHKHAPIYDKVVLSRAWATLPSHLQIFRLGATAELGVFSKRPVPNRTKFGPFFAPCVENAEQLSNKKLIFKVDTEEGMQYYLEATDENNCNWMMFVRPAENYAEQNLIVYQYRNEIFFSTIKNIEPKHELKVWYAAPYARQIGLQPHRLPEENMRGVQGKWPCYECNKSFKTSSLLQKHLNVHDDMGGDEDDDSVADEDDVTTRRGRRKSGRGKGGKSRKIKEMVGGDNTVFQSWKKRKTNMYLNKIKKYREPIKRSLMTLYKKQGKDTGGNEWVCTHCDLTFDNPSLLNLHTLTHAAEDLAMVDLNSALVSPMMGAGDMVQGLENVVQGYPVQSDQNGVGENGQSVIQWDENNLQCPVCDKVFLVKQELSLHVSEHARRGRRQLRVHPRKPFKCMTCWKCFSSEERLVRHSLCHNEATNRPFKCSNCFRKFMTNSALACHMKTHSDRKYYECLICGAGFDQVHVMKYHITTHSVNGQYDCPECHKSCPSYHLIRRHIRSFHSNKCYACTECNKQFPRPDKLKVHMLKHSSHREFMCETCGRQFKRKDKLKEHMRRVHDPNRDKKPRTPSTASPQKKFIPKVEPNDYNRFIYKCHSCMLGFKRRGMLVNHLAKRHPDMKADDIPELNLPILRTQRDYFCQYCDKVYKSSSKRKLHILKYHPGCDVPPSVRTRNLLEKMGVPNASFSQLAGSVTTMAHSCPLCHKQYASKAKLLQHQRKEHTDISNLTDSYGERRSPDMTQLNPASLLDKPRLLAAIIQKPMDNSSEVITITPHNMHTLESLQGTDLLTQAMTELNPTWANEFRHQTQGGGTEVEYHLTVSSNGTTLLQPPTANLQQHSTTIDLNHLTSALGQSQTIQQPQQHHFQKGSVVTSVAVAQASETPCSVAAGSQIISPGTIAVVGASQAAQVLAGTIPITLAPQYLQKANGVQWNSQPSNIQQNQR